MTRSSLLCSFALAASLGVAQAQMGQSGTMGGQTGTTGYPGPTGTGGYPGGTGRTGTMGPMSQPGTVGSNGQPCTMTGQPDPTGSPQPMGGPASGQPCQTTDPAQQATRVDDSALQQTVQQQLANDPAFADVKAISHNGRIDLTGSVPSKADRGRAKDIAKNVPGVTGVREHLSVGGGSSSPSSVGSSSGSSGNMGGASGRTVPGNSGTATPDPGSMNTRPDTAAPPPQSTPPTVPQNSTVPQAMSYSAGARLLYAAYQAGAPATVPQQGQGAMGQPNSPAASEDGGHPASNASANPTASGLGSQTDNATLQSQIESAIRNEPTLANSRVSVQVTNEAVQLTGAVPSGKDKVTAERLARSYAADRKLTDNLTVTGHGHSDMSQEHPAMNNSGTGNAVNPNTGRTGSSDDNQNPRQPH